MLTDDTVIKGYRKPDDGSLVVVLKRGGTVRYLPHTVHHSPDGFEVGYGGSGPADLALSILETVLDEKEKPVDLYQGHCGQRAWNLHQPFKWQFVACFPKEGFEITVKQVRDWLMQQKSKD